MEYSDKNVRSFSYNSTLDMKNKKKSIISVKYSATIDGSQSEKLYSKLVGCVKKDKTDDSVEIVRSIRSAFDDVEEIALTVCIKKDNYIQDADFYEGDLVNCNFIVRNNDDIVSISRNCRGTDIRYKKRENLVPSAVYSEIGTFLSKIDELSNLEYVKKSRTKKRTKQIYSTFFIRQNS